MQYGIRTGSTDWGCSTPKQNRTYDYSIGGLGNQSSRKNVPNLEPSFVSIVITAYNRAAYLAIAIDSVIAQTYPHWELIIWDDGSIDDSPTIAKQYALQDSRIRFVQGVHAGATAALVGAMALVTHPYYGCVDSDDSLHPDALAKTVEILDRQNEIGMVYTNYDEIDECGRYIRAGRRCSIPYSKERMLIDFMTFHFRLIRRSVYEAVGGIDLDLLHCEDYNLCLKISEIAEIYHLAEFLYSYRLHAGMVSYTERDVQKDSAVAAVRKALVRRGMSDRYYLEVTGWQFRILELPASHF